MEFMVIAAAHFLALLSPGPDFFLILQSALRFPRRAGFAVCCGIAAANGIYVFCAVLGLELARELSPLMVTLKFLGAAYLIFLGVLLLRAPLRPLEHDTGGAGIQTPTLGRQFLMGFGSGILNPKNAIFYLSLFTVMVSTSTGLSIRFLYALWMTGVVLVWDCALVWFIGREQFRACLGGAVFYLEKCSGFMLALFGLMLPFR